MPILTRASARSKERFAACYKAYFVHYSINKVTVSGDDVKWMPEKPVNEQKRR
jgi:hypothetical protein